MEESRPRPKTCPVCGGKAKVDRRNVPNSRFRVVVRCFNSCNGRKDKQEAITVFQKRGEKQAEMVERAIKIWNALPRPKETKDSEAPD